MKKYVKPIMNLETFMTNEYASACNDSLIACLNMNEKRWLTVYQDTNGNGIIDTGEKKFTDWNEKNDCGMNGDATASKHTITDDQIKDLSNRVIVVYDNGKTRTETPAIMTYDVAEDAPHFVSLKAANHS